MTDGGLLAALDRRHIVAQARAEASRAGVDPDALLDSITFYNKAIALDPDAPDFHGQIRQLVRDHSASRTAAAPSPAGDSAREPSGQAAAAGQAQWTMDDVRRASPAQTAAAAGQGLLRDLGYSPRRPRR